MSFHDGDTLIPLGDPWTSQSMIWVRRDANGETFRRFLHANDGQPSEFKTLSAPPDASAVFVTPHVGSPEEADFDGLQHLVERTLDNATNGTLQLDRLLDKLETETKFKRSFIEGCVRTLAAQQALLIAAAKVAKPQFDVRLSPDARERERRRATRLHRDLRL